MNSYLKISSTKNNTHCNCISPFYIDSISGINPSTGHYYTDDDKDILKTSLYRISNAKGCEVGQCCDPNDPTKTPDADFTNKFLQNFPKIMPIYEGSNLVSVKLSTTNNVKTNGWIAPTPHLICKISKSIVNDTSDPTIKIATNLVSDCFTNNCSPVESITMDNLLQNAKSDMKYTFLDDARVTQAIRENNISYVKEYIKKYKQIDSPLTNDSYSNRMIHIACDSNSLNILNMLIALKANLNITNKLNETPMHFAVRKANLDNISALLMQGIDLTIANSKGETAMFYAMITGDIRIINMLYNNASPLLNIDNSGNNLIHYCILNCPSFKNVDDDTKNASNSITNSKADIIRFLIEHGVSSEQINLAGLTPLEMTEKEINREINRECALNISNQNSTINEKFFNVKPIIPNKNKIENFTNNNTNNNVKINDINNYTTEHQSLLEVQSMIFNNVIRNNPKKYSDYISTDDIPKGAPIEILDTICYGDGMTGNEDSYDCIAKGGQIVKIKNKTTKIKIELTPENDVDIDNVNQSELYFDKNPEKIPKTNYPSNVKDYNSMYNESPNEVPKTTAGVTYNIGQDSSNELNSIQTTMAFNPQPTNAYISQPTNNPAITTSSIQKPSDTVNKPLDHPPMYDDTIIHKCKTDAIYNSTKITQAQLYNETNPQTTFFSQTQSADSNQTETTIANISSSSVFQKYKILFIILIVLVILLIIGIVVYKVISNRKTSNNNFNSNSNSK
jgi:ankyrin repeat protein